MENKHIYVYICTVRDSIYYNKNRVNITWRFRSSVMRAIAIFFRPITQVWSTTLLSMTNTSCTLYACMYIHVCTRMYTLVYYMYVYMHITTCILYIHVFCIHVYYNVHVYSCKLKACVQCIYMYMKWHISHIT